MIRILFSPWMMLFLATVLTGCTATGPADDGWETSEGFKEGDGLFSKGEGGYRFSMDRHNHRQQREQRSPQSSRNHSADKDEAVKYNTQAPTDYETYLRWRQSRDSHSQEYQRFLKWQEFEDYLRWKQSQPSR